ncbi:MAG: hypothetical protein B1H04_06825 [Planctomycetales bacterium 4484_123]|nr:MAG: hypothetical protein B1H04_06825 [Planctomycetales bacterium 4484_123]
MYLLKLRRRELPVSSTLLWRRAVQDLQVNAPFQRLRLNLLLVLQLLALLAVLTALAGPVLSLRARAGRRYVILIDCSASMNATDVRPNRLAEAKRQARQFVESLRTTSGFSLGQEAEQAMVIAFANTAKVMCGFTSDTHRLLRAIEAVRPTDGGSALATALTVARAFAQSPGEDAGGRGAAEPARLELFTDGRIADTAKLAVNPGELVFHRVGQGGGNVGIVAMQARRSFERAQEVNVFATLANYRPEAVDLQVQLAVDGNVRAVRDVHIPPARAGQVGQVAAPGKTSISFTLAHGGAGVVELRQLRPDALASDDAAWAVLAPPRKLSVLLVSAGNFALESALKACSLGRLEVKTPAEFDAIDREALDADQPYDVIVLDRHLPQKLPRGRFMVFGAPPAGIGVKVERTIANQVVVDWRRRHPVLQHVDLDNLFVLRARRLSLPRDAQVLAEFGEGPALALVSRRASTYLLASFDLMQSNWPFDVGFVIFCYNATRFLGGELARTEEGSLRVGQAIELRVGRRGQSARVRGPGGIDLEVRPDAAGTLRFAGTWRAGVYTVQPPHRRARRYAVNLLDANESNIAPADEMLFSGQPVKAQVKPAGSANRELWPLLALAALALVCLEWLVYNSKVRL